MTRSKWLTLGLIASIGINIALIGFVAGRASAIDVRPIAMDPTMGFARLLPELSEARRRELRPLVRRHVRSVHPSMREVRSAQRDLRSALLADPFDGTALEAALEQFREHLVESQATSHASFAGLAEQLTPAERRLLVAQLGRDPRYRGFGAQARDGRPPVGPQWHHPQR